MDKDFRKIKLLIKEWFESHPFVDIKGKIRLSEPIFSENEVNAVLEILLLSNGWIAQGPKVAEFEKRFAEYLGVKECIAVNSGSSANLLGFAALKELGYLKQGDEVIMPAATFITVAAPVVQLGLTPVFVDVRIDGNIDPTEIEKAITSKTKIIMPVHTLGKPAAVDEIKGIAKKHSLLIFEDACEAHGAGINGKKVGSFGIIGTFSFYVAHNITTGEGGMISTNNEELSLVIRSLREFGRYRSKKSFSRFSVRDEVLGYYDTQYLFSRVGYNLRMSDMHAALGIEQLKKLDIFNKKRNKNAQYLIENLKSFEKFFHLPVIDKNEDNAFYGFLLAIKKSAPFTRADLVTYLEKEGIETRPLFAGCIPDQPAFRNKNFRVAGKLSVSRHFRDNAIFIGCHPGLDKQELRKIISSIDTFIKIYRQ